MQISPQQREEALQTFATHGYCVLPDVVPKLALAALHRNILAAFEHAKQARELFSGGGTVSGHLNCFPGAESRFVYEAIRECGVLDLVRVLEPGAVRLPNVGCNLNLPGSGQQNFHVDGYAARPFMVVNVAGVDTNLVNGAMEACPGSQLRSFKYWQFVLARLPSVRVQMKQGDVLIRTSSLWHRGMPNRSAESRPMLAFTWEGGGSTLADPYAVHGGKVRFFPNRYGTDLASTFRERAFVAAPALGSGYRFVRSWLERQS